MKINMLPIQRPLRSMACAAVAITLFVLPGGVALARGGHGGGGHGGGHSPSHAAAAPHGGFGRTGIHSVGTNRGRFARGAGGQFANSRRHNLTHQRSLHSVPRSARGQLVHRTSQRSGNLNRHFVANHHHHHNNLFFSPFGLGPYYYGYGYSLYGNYADVCNPYSPYYDPFYCEQLYYQGY